jgi:hypothetical protein
MANIVIKELLSSDKVSELVDKINFNFDQLLLNGGGPIGLTGGPGGIGPIGPRGSVWFTVNDLYTTSDSPTWTGTPVKINNISLPGYPQYKGDPNRFRPVAPTGVTPSLPWTLPQKTFTFSIPTKTVRGGDLYLQESDDTFNSYSSKDGDIWEYNALSLTWSFTGVNIKGTTGAGGANALSDWVRESLGSSEIIYPKSVSGQDITRVLIGQDSNIFNLDNSIAALTINTDATHLAFNHPDLHSELVVPGDEDKGATISITGDGDLLIIGSSATGASNQIVMQTLDKDITIQSNGINFLTYRQTPSTSIHHLDGGAIEVSHPNNAALQYTKYTAAASPSIDHVLNQSFDTVNSRIHLYSSASSGTAPNIILQGYGTSNVGIGVFGSFQNPLSKLGVKGNVSIGNTYGYYPAPTNGLIVEGNTGLGTLNPYTKLQVNGSILIGSANEYIGDNVIWSGTGFAPVYNGAGWFFKQNPTTVDVNAEFNLYLTSIGTTGTDYSQSSVITFRQTSGAEHGKVGLNMGGWGTDSRLTINDTDGTGIHLIRFQTKVPGSSDFYNSLTAGARIYHTASNNILLDKRLNIYQFENNDLVIGNRTDNYPTATTHHRIVIKKESGFIGFNTLRPKHIATFKGRDYITEPDLNGATPVGGFDPDEVNIGTFEDIAINGLNINTAPSHNETNIQGASYIGFNAWFSNPGTPGSNPEVIYGDLEGSVGSYAGAIIFADRNGNLHFANYEQ